MYIKMLLYVNDFKGYKILLDETLVMGHQNVLDVGSMLIIEGDSRGFFLIKCGSSEICVRCSTILWAMLV